MPMILLTTNVKVCKLVCCTSPQMLDTKRLTTQLASDEATKAFVTDFSEVLALQTLLGRGLI
jgi:hypothetical protein